MYARFYAQNESGETVACYEDVVGDLLEALDNDDDIRAALGFSDEAWGEEESGEFISAFDLKRLVERIEADDGHEGVSEFIHLCLQNMENLKCKYIQIVWDMF